MTLSDLIIQKIKQQGPIPFQEFMDMCLYHPGLGYYTSPSTKIGPTGDFYTSASLTPVFGTLIGKQLEEMWAILGKEPFTIVEYGAGTGALCADILSYLKNNASLYDPLRYCIIEKSPFMQAIERSHLPDKVSWHESMDELGEITGCILSNELVDTFAVHAVIMQQQLMEVFVGYDTGFQEILRPASQELTNYLNELDVHLSPGYHTEINLQAVNWIQSLATALKRGYVLTIDYGFESTDLYIPGRSQGTLRCYRNHTTNTSLYEQIGGQDITTFINFSALAHWGAKYGLTTCGLTDQGHFLLALGLTEAIEQAFCQETNILQAARQASQLRNTLLMDMGTKFKCLLQSKGVAKQPLSGLKLLSMEKG